MIRVQPGTAQISLHDASPVAAAARGGQQAPERQLLVTPAAASSTFLAYIPALDYYTEVYEGNIGAGPSTAPALPSPACLWLNGAWRTFERCLPPPPSCPAGTHSYSQAVRGNSTERTEATGTLGTNLSEHPALSAQGASGQANKAMQGYTLLVFGPDKTKTTLSSVQVAIGQAMRLTTPPTACPLLGLCWMQDNRVLVSLKEAQGRRVKQQQEQQLSQQLRRLFRWRCRLLQNGEGVFPTAVSKQRPAQNPTAAVAGQGSARTLPASLAARAWAATTKQQQGARGPRQEGEWQQARGRALRVRNAPAEPLPLSNIFAALLSRVAGEEEEQQPAAIGLQQQQPMRKQHQQPMMQQSQQQQQQSPAVDDADMQYINKLLNWLAASPSKQVPAPKAPTSWVAGAPSAVASEQQQQQQRQQQHTRESGRAQEQQPSQQRRNRPRRTCQPTRWLVVGSLNVAGMSEVALADVKRIVVNQGIDVLAVQESWEGSGQCKVGQIKGYSWFGRPREGGMHGGISCTAACCMWYSLIPKWSSLMPCG